jgi:hypothetical protein
MAVLAAVPPSLSRSDMLATRLLTHWVSRLIEQSGAGESEASVIGLAQGRVRFTDFEPFSRLIDIAHQRRKPQWQPGLRDIVGAPVTKAGTAQRRAHPRAHRVERGESKWLE